MQERSTKTPGITPGEKAVKKLLLFFLGTLETLGWVDVAVEEVGDGVDELQVGRLDWLLQVSSDVINTDVSGRLEGGKEMILKRLWHDVIVGECGFDPCLDEGSPSKLLGGHEDHTTSRDGSWRGDGKILNLEEHSHLGSELNSLSIGQTKSHVIIKHSVHVLNPESIDWTIENNPSLFLTLL